MGTLPGVVCSVAGPVPVVRVAGLRDEKGRVCLGRFLSASRTIEIEAELDPTTAELTFWHEWAHAVFFDVGIQLSEANEERVADAIGLARTVESRYSAL